MKALSIVLLWIGLLLAGGVWSAAEAGQHIHAPAAAAAAEHVTESDATAVAAVAPDAAPASHQAGCITTACCASLCGFALPAPVPAVAAIQPAARVAILSDAGRASVTPGGLLRPPQPIRRPHDNP